MAGPLMAHWRLDGQCALVTGGTKGLGLACVEEFLNLGAKVLFTARSADDLEAVGRELREKHGDKVQWIAADVSTRQGRDTLVGRASLLWSGRLDILVNNVGTNKRLTMSEVDEGAWSVQVDTNMTGAFFLCKACLPLLRKSDYASVVNVTSLAGMRSSGTGVVYAMTKAAVNHMSAALACEWAPFKIRVNAVAPWMVLTPLLEEATRNDPAQLRRVCDATPLGRLGAVEDTANAVSFLCMRASKYITGQVFAVDGGLSAQGFRGPCVDLTAAQAGVPPPGGAPAAAGAEEGAGLGAPAEGGGAAGKRKTGDGAGAAEGGPSHKQARREAEGAPNVKLENGDADMPDLPAGLDPDGVEDEQGDGVGAEGANGRAVREQPVAQPVALPPAERTPLAPVGRLLRAGFTPARGSNEKVRVQQLVYLPSTSKKTSKGSNEPEAVLALGLDGKLWGFTRKDERPPPVAGGAGHEPFDQEKIKFIKVHAEDPLLNSIGNCSAPPMIKPLARKRAIFSVINKEVIIHHIPDKKLQEGPLAKGDVQTYRCVDMDVHPIDQNLIACAAEDGSLIVRHFLLPGTHTTWKSPTPDRLFVRFSPAGNNLVVLRRDSEAVDSCWSVQIYDVPATSRIPLKPRRKPRSGFEEGEEGDRKFNEAQEEHKTLSAQFTDGARREWVRASQDRNRGEMLVGSAFDAANTGRDRPLDVVMGPLQDFLLLWEDVVERWKVKPLSRMKSSHIDGASCAIGFYWSVSETGDAPAAFFWLVGTKNSELHLLRHTLEPAMSHTPAGMLAPHVRVASTAGSGSSPMHITALAVSQPQPDDEGAPIQSYHAKDGVLVVGFDDGSVKQFRLVELMDPIVEANR